MDEHNYYRREHINKQGDRPIFSKLEVTNRVSSVTPDFRSWGRSAG